MTETEKEGDLLLNLSRELTKRLLREFGGRPRFAQYGILRLVQELDSPRMKQLAAAVGVRQATLTQVVDLLVGRGLVRRLADPKDRRAVRLALTSKGRRQYAAMTRVRKRFIVRLVSNLSAKDRQELTRIVRALVASLT
jgi:DNA-binding MarR family transcriptional regulator